jgi:drug/metabolite transporter (DMT)-like permease
MTGRLPARPGAGITLILLMAACFATMDTAVKYVGALLPILVVLLARYGVQAASMGLWLAVSQWRGGAGFRSAHPRFQAVRGALLLTSSTFGFLGLRHLPVAEFTAINMLTPVMVTLLAATLLREHVSRLRWALVVGGFAGALIVIRPGSGLFGWAVLLPLAGSVAYASFQVLTRKLSALESPYTTHFYTGLTGTLVVAALLLASEVPLRATLQDASALQIGLLLAIGTLGTLGHLMLVLAFGLAPTATLMPFMYVQIAFAAAVGWLVFRHAPDGWGWLGMAVVSVCGAASAWLNVREAAASRAPVTALGADTIAD